MTTLSPPAALGRLAKQGQLVPHDKLAPLAISVIGVGAIGSALALLLAKLGARRLQLVDPDVVDLSNCTVQSYVRSEIDQPKVAALAKRIAEIDDACQVETHAQFWSPRLRTHPVLFTCVDSISVREAIWRETHPRLRFFADGRMHAESVHVYVAAAENGAEAVPTDYYPTTLFPEEESYSDSCTAYGVSSTPQVAASIMAHQFARWLRGAPCDKRTVYNMAGSALFTE